MRKTLKFLMLLAILLLLSSNSSSFANLHSKHLDAQALRNQNYVLASYNIRACEKFCRFAYRSCLRSCTNSPMRSFCISNCEMGYENCLSNCYRTYSQ